LNLIQIFDLDYSKVFEECGNTLKSIEKFLTFYKNNEKISRPNPEYIYYDYRDPNMWQMFWELGDIKLDPVDAYVLYFAFLIRLILKDYKNYHIQVCEKHSFTNIYYYYY